MDFLNNITVYQITHSSIVRFDKNEKAVSNNRQYHGIAFSLGGELYYTSKGKNIYLKNNNIVYLPEGSSYTLHCTIGGEFAIINFNTVENNFCTEFISQQTRYIDTIINEFYTMHDIMSGSNQKRCNLLSTFYKIVSIIVYETANNILPSTLRTAINFIDNNIDNCDLSNTLTAEHTKISEIYLRKLFTKHLNISVKQYIQNKRIEKAKLLLSENTLSITNISARCGYSSVYYFCRAFKHNTGYTPSEYKLVNKPL